MMKTAPFQFDWSASSNGCVIWMRVVPVDEIDWARETNPNGPELFVAAAEANTEYLLSCTLNGEPPFDWQHRFFGLETAQHRSKLGIGPLQVTIWKLSYWLLITPLTLVSAYLLLSRPRLRPTTIPCSATTPGGARPWLF